MTAEADVGTQTEVIGRRNVSFMPYFVYSPPPDNISRTVVETALESSFKTWRYCQNLSHYHHHQSQKKNKERRYNAKRGWGLDVKQ